MRSGLRYIQYAPPLKAVLTRAFIFTIFVSAVWSLLAVVAARDLHQGALGYGILNGSMGLGAVIGATSLPHIRRKFSADVIVQHRDRGLYRDSARAGVRPLSPGHQSRAAGGRFCLDEHHVDAQSRGAGLGAPLGAGPRLGHLPDGLFRRHGARQCHLGAHCRTSLHAHLARRGGRGLADHFAFQSSPVCGCCGEQPDLLSLRSTYVVPQLAMEPEMSDGPVRILIDCNRIDEQDYKNSSSAIHELRDVRLRDGAMRWGIFQDASDPRRLNETFIMESWIDYLRQLERFTASDRTRSATVWSVLPSRRRAAARHPHDLRQRADECNNAQSRQSS